SETLVDIRRAPGLVKRGDKNNKGQALAFSVVPVLLLQFLQQRTAQTNWKLFIALRGYVLAARVAEPTNSDVFVAPPCWIGRNSFDRDLGTSFSYDEVGRPPLDQTAGLL